MSVAPQELSETGSFIFAPMDHARSQAANQMHRAGTISPWVAYSIAIPSTVAMVISAYLAYATFTMSEVAGCGGGSVFDCGHVLHSKWSKAAGVPVSVFAFLTHAVVISGLFASISQRCGQALRTIATCAVLTAAIATTLAALYFISLQVFVLKHLCSYCMGAHACGLIVGVMACWKLPITSGAKTLLSGFSLAGIVALASIQISSAEPPKYKIDTFAPIETDQSADEDGAFESPGGQSIELFSAPGDSDSAEGTNIFAPPSEDGASNTKRKGPFHAHAQALAMLSMISSRSMAYTCSATLVASPDQPSGAKPATSSQSAGKAKQAPQKPSPPAKIAKFVPMNGGTIKLKSTDWPLIGPPDAKHIFIEMFDYTCAHCRATNAAIELAKKKLGDDLAVVALPVPMNVACNPLIKTNMPAHAESCELSRLAIAVWRLAPEKFGDFHHWMFQGKTAPSYGQAFAKAAESLGSEKLNKELAKSVCREYVERNVELYKRAGGGPIPKMVFKQTTIVGEFTSGESLINLIKQYTSAK